MPWLPHEFTTLNLTISISSPSSFLHLGTLDLELVNVAGVNSASHPIAKCYNSMTVTVTDTCTLSVTANGQDNYVPAIYSADPTYSQVGGCPAGGTTIVYTDDATITDADNVATLIATSIYATGLTATAAVEAGIVTITSSGATLKFRPSSKTGTSEVSPAAMHRIFPGASHLMNMKK